MKNNLNLKKLISKFIRNRNIDYKIFQINENRSVMHISTSNTLTRFELFYKNNKLYNRCDSEWSTGPDPYKSKNINIDYNYIQNIEKEFTEYFNKIELVFIRKNKLKNLKF